MNETIMSVAIIGALAGAIASVVKVFFTKNENTQSQYEYQLKLVELTSKQGESIENMYKSITRVHERIDEVNKRLDEIEGKL